MKNKFAALLAALLLTLSLLPAQAFAAADPEPVDPPAVTDAGEQETPDEPKSPVLPIRPMSPPPPMDPEPDKKTH